MIEDAAAKPYELLATLWLDPQWPSLTANTKQKTPSLCHFLGGLTLFAQPITGLHFGLTARETALLIFAASAAVSFQSTPVHTGKRKPHYKQQQHTHTHKRLSRHSAPMTSGAHGRKKWRQQCQLGKVEATTERSVQTPTLLFSLCTKPLFN